MYMQIQFQPNEHFEMKNENTGFPKSILYGFQVVCQIIIEISFAFGNEPHVRMIYCLPNMFDMPGVISRFPLSN